MSQVDVPATFLDLQTEHRTAISNVDDLNALLDGVTHRPPFLGQLVSEGGELTIGIGEVGCVQHSPPGGLGPYLMAVYRNAQEVDEFVEFLAGNQPSEIPLRLTMPFEIARRVVIHFLENGRLSDIVNWEPL